MVLIMHSSVTTLISTESAIGQVNFKQTSNAFKEFRKLLNIVEYSSNVDIVIMKKILSQTRFEIRSTVCNIPHWRCAICHVQVDQLILYQKIQVQGCPLNKVYPE